MRPATSGVDMPVMRIPQMREATSRLYTSVKAFPNPPSRTYTQGMHAILRSILAMLVDIFRKCARPPPGGTGKKCIS